MPMMSMLNALPATLAQSPQNGGDLSEGVSLMLVGMVVVFAALILVGAMIGLLKMMAAVESATAAAEAATSAAKAATAAAEAVSRRASAPAAPTAQPAAQPVEQPAVQPAMAAAPAAQPAAAPPQPAGGIDAQTLVILAAAAATIVGGRVRVRNVEFIRRQGSGGWGQRGRLGIHTSHNLQNRNR